MASRVEFVHRNHSSVSINGSVVGGRARDKLKIALGVFSCAFLLSTTLSAFTHNDTIASLRTQPALDTGEQSSGSGRQLQQLHMPALFHLAAATTPPDKRARSARELAVQAEYEKHIAGGFIQGSFGMLFAPRVMRYYRDIIIPPGGDASSTKILDAGCGQCKVVEYLRELGYDAHGVEVSEAALKEPACVPLTEAQHVQQGWLTDIPHPDDTFDFVFSSDVLEHIPTEDIPRVVKELVRVSKGHIFLSIALALSKLDPRPPQQPTIHVTVKPREWWEKMFIAEGCRMNTPAKRSVLGGRRKDTAPNFFAFRCKEKQHVVTPKKDIGTDPRWRTANMRELWRTNVVW